MMVCIFYTVVIHSKDHLSKVDDDGKEKRSRLRKQKREHSTDQKVTEHVEANIGLFDSLYSYFLRAFDNDEKVKERKKANFVHSLQKYIKTIQ